MDFWTAGMVARRRGQKEELFDTAPVPDGVLQSAPHVPDGHNDYANDEQHHARSLSLIVPPNPN
jgi:hypothetical protein